MGNKQNKIQTDFELNIIITGNTKKTMIKWEYYLIIIISKITKPFKNIAY